VVAREQEPGVAVVPGPGGVAAEQGAGAWAAAAWVAPVAAACN